MSLLELKRVHREFPAGDSTVCVLKDVDLAIDAGEMVAIVGASGSGKSTLMNILGCLDRATSGTYRIGGVDTATLDADALAALRREHFGFVFQRYHLLNELTALANVESPAIYSGGARGERRARAAKLLQRLGLGEHMGRRPNQLSGGEQQRVSIARALMNGGQVILADEPTGALDKHSGEEMLKILKELHALGHTVVIVTHDMQVAEHSERIIKISDGEIIADRRIEGTTIATAASSEGIGIIAPSNVLRKPGQPQDPGERHDYHADWDRFREAFHIALVAMRGHRLRTFLTMLGIIIGIASVVSVVALGEGTRRRILQDISAMGTNTVDIYGGSDFGDVRALSIHTLVPGDAYALERQPYVDSVTPSVSSSSTLRYRSIVLTATIRGVGEDYFRVHGMQLAQGIAFDRRSVDSIAQEVVIDDNMRKKLFPEGQDPVGQVVLMGKVPCRVIGVTAAQTSLFMQAYGLTAWVPYTTALVRMLGQPYLDSVTVRVTDSAAVDAAEQGIVSLLRARHGTKDFYVSNNDTIRKTIQASTATLSLLILAIALISLIVGGIGVMNIMLVSVSERTREIGIRMAIGARQSDIMQQFIIEAVLVCLFGGVLGIGLALCGGLVFGYAVEGLQMTFSPVSMIAAFACSTAIGILFGYWPARNAARLDPIDALARD